MPDPFDDHLDEPASAWGVDGPAFGRRPAAVESLRHELARYLADDDPFAGAASEVEASRNP